MFLAFAAPGMELTASPLLILMFVLVNSDWKLGNPEWWFLTWRFAFGVCGMIQPNVHLSLTCALRWPLSFPIGAWNLNDVPLSFLSSKRRICTRWGWRVLSKHYMHLKMRVPKNPPIEWWEYYFIINPWWQGYPYFRKYPHVVLHGFPQMTNRYLLHTSYKPIDRFFQQPVWGHIYKTLAMHFLNAGIARFPMRPKIHVTWLIIDR